MSWRRRILLAVVSGMSAWPLGYVLEWLDSTNATVESIISYVVIGGVFGALVLVPFVGARPLRIGRGIALVLGSILVYALVVELAVEKYGPLDLDYDIAVIASGLLGALLVGMLAMTAAPLQTSSRFWLYLPVAGLAGGYLFSLLWASSDELVTAMGYVAWQVPVCLALYGGSVTDGASA